VNREEVNSVVLIWRYVSGTLLYTEIKFKCDSGAFVLR